jgi:hypothetical protein
MADIFLLCNVRKIAWPIVSCVSIQMRDHGSSWANSMPRRCYEMSHGETVAADCNMSIALLVGPYAR